MKLGFLTACLPGETLEEIVGWAASEGFEALEVAAWPALGNRPFTATHLDVDDLSDLRISEIRSLTQEANIEFSSVSFYDNNLHQDTLERALVNAHLHKCIDAAACLGIATVGTFVGRDVSLPVADNLRLAEGVFAPVVAHANDVGVKIVIENCVMEGWHPDGYPGNLAYSPELWEWMFDLGLYLNFDPSHLLWMGIDPAAVIAPYADRIAHAQAKDIQLFPEARNRYGYLGKAVSRDNPWDVGWWRYRVPGLGQVDWVRVCDALHEAGFDGVLSVEHEDPVWGGTPEKVKQGLRISHRTLDHLVHPGGNRS